MALRVRTTYTSYGGGGCNPPPPPPHLKTRPCSTIGDVYVNMCKEREVTVNIVWVTLYHIQWAFGVTCWEVFTGGKMPYPAVDSSTLPELLLNGMRLNRPPNAACSMDM